MQSVSVIQELLSGNKIKKQTAASHKKDFSNLSDRSRFRKNEFPQSK